MNDRYEQGFKAAPVWLRQHTIMLGEAGSHLYGTNIETSDWDYRGVCVLPRAFVYGLNTFEQYHSPEDCDVDLCVFSLRKFVNLCLRCNPNVLEILWCPPEKRVINYYLWDWLYKERRSFLSKRAFKSFSGYAMSQLHKVRASCERDGTYDSKNAMHLVRLMRMGNEILRDGEVIVVRPDADYLLAIRNHEVPLEAIIEEHDRQFSLMSDLRDSSPLPDNPDYDRINLVVMRIVETSLLNGV